MNEMAKHAIYNGKTICIDSKTQNEKYHVWVKSPIGEKILFKSPFDFRVEKSLDGKHMKLLIIPKSKQQNLLLGSGAYKDVYALHEFDFDNYLTHKKRTPLSCKNSSTNSNL